MPRSLVVVWLAALSSAAACGDDGARAVDAGVADARAVDSGGPGLDAGFDAGAEDAGLDAGPDSGTADASSLDASTATGGTGGAFPGPQTRSATVGGETFDYFLYIPGSYDPAVPVAVLGVFHGQGGNGSTMRDFWSTTAEANGFVVLATTSTGPSGGWLGGRDVLRFDGALTEAGTAYNVERSRLYLWGFSAGAHLVHGVGLLNADVFAAYSVSAGALEGYAGVDAPTMALRRIPVDIHMGMSDSLFMFSERDIPRFTAAGWVEGVDLSYVIFAGGHTVRPEHRQEIWDFLEPFTLP